MGGLVHYLNVNKIFECCFVFIERFVDMAATAPSVVSSAVVLRC